MRYDILHELPGRIRVHFRQARANPECVVELTRWLEEHDELLTASLCTRTGNLLVLYSRKVSRESILTLLDGLRLFEVATLACNQSARRPRPPEMDDSSVPARMIWILAKPFLPSPIKWIMIGWRLTLRLYDVRRPLRRGEAASCMVMAAKWLLRALVGRSTPIKLFLLFAGAILRFYRSLDVGVHRLPEPDHGMRLRHGAAGMLTLSDGHETQGAAG